MKKPVRPRRKRFDQYWWFENCWSVVIGVFVVIVIGAVVYSQIVIVAPLRETCLHGATQEERMEACRECAFQDQTCKLEYQHGRD